MICLAIISLNIILNFFIKDAGLLNNIINPIFWIILSIGTALTVPKKSLNKKNDTKTFQMSIIISLIYIAVYSLFGVLVTFGKNPYSITFIGLIINFWITGVIIICKEYVRCKILSNVSKSKKRLMLFLTTVIFSLIEIEIGDVIASFTGASALFRQVVSNVLPIIIKNALFTFIATKHSPKSAIAYQLLINMFFWLSPILPNSPWILVAILDTVIPFIFFVIVKMQADEKEIVLGRARREENDIKGTVAFGCFVVLIASFATGLFPVEPKAVATASMEPTINTGDVAIIKKCEGDQVEVGDVVEYQLEKQFIIHRIIGKEKELGKTHYITQGDNNNSPDARPVEEEQIIGKVVYHIRYLGLPAVWLSRLTSANEEALVETGK